MRIPRVFFEDSLEIGATSILSRDQAHYLGRVLRLNVGREVAVFNGEGGEYLCQITELDGRRGSILVKEHRETDTESPVDICLAIGLSKGDRFDWVVQKATELGVSLIQPLLTERSEIRLSDARLGKKMAHWQGIVTSACEQSGRTKIPRLNPPSSFSNFIGENTTRSLILDPLAKSPLSELPLADDTSSINLIVGPEGGLSRDEIDLACDAGSIAARMGPRILRTETAPIAALAVIQLKLGDW